jgi:hypothetical protein
MFGINHVSVETLNQVPLRFELVTILKTCCTFKQKQSKTHRHTEHGSYEITEAIFKRDFKEKSTLLTGGNSL